MYTPLTGNIKIELFWKAYVELFHDTHIKEKHFQQICTCNMVSTELWCYFMLQESSFIFLKLQDETSQDSYKAIYGFSSVCAQIRQPCMHKVDFQLHMSWSQVFVMSLLCFVVHVLFVGFVAFHFPSVFPSHRVYHYSSSLYINYLCFGFPYLL